MDAAPYRWILLATITISTFILGLMKPILATALVFSSILLSSCGGGSAGSTVTPPGTTPIGGISTVSAAQLQGCPLGDFSTTGDLPAGVSGCMRGIISGVTALHGTDVCTVEYDGLTTTYKSQALNMTLVVDTKTKVQFRHSTTNGQHILSDWRDQYDATTKVLNYVHTQYSQPLDVALANVMIQVQVGSQRGECYAKL